MNRLCRFVSVLFLLAALVAAPGWQADRVMAGGTAEGTTGGEPVNATIPMSDGIKIAASIYTPDGKEPVGGWPAVILIHGWGGDRHTYDSIAPVFERAGYVVLTYDSRGFGQSEGKTSLAGPREMQDLQELMQYLIDHFRVNPEKIGASGISYGGGQSFLLAAFTHALGYTGPKVKAIAPIMGWTDLVDALLPNGVMKASYDLGLFSLGFKPEKQNYNTDLAAWLVEGVSGVNQDDFKRELALRSVIQQADRLYDVPIYALQAWKDELFPVEQVTRLFDTIRPYNPNLKLYAGGFGHPAAEFNPQEENWVFSQVLAWFDYWLKGVENGILKRDGRVLIGSESWPAGVTYPFPPDDPKKAAIEWPPHIMRFASWPNTLAQSYYLSPRRMLTQPAAARPEVMVNGAITGGQDDSVVGGPVLSPIRNPLDQIQQHSSPLALQYQTAPLGSDTTVLGLVRLRLWIASANPDAMITARLYDVAQDGKRTLVTRGAVRARNLSFDSPSELAFDLFAAHHVFRQGHSIQLELSPSDTPFFLPDAKTLSIRLFHDEQYPSRITIPILAQ